MTDTLAELEANMAKQQARGDFCYWAEDSEAAFKAAAPAKPAPLVLNEGPYKRPILVQVVPNYYHPTRPGAKPDTFAGALECGKSYLVGDSVPMDTFLRGHRSCLTSWQKRAFEWCKANPFYCLAFDMGRYSWKIRARGEYVEFGLPHQDMGGERHYVTLDGSSKVLVNVD